MKLSGVWPPPSASLPRARSLSLGSLTMLRTSILLCTASAAALSLVESPSVNDYELVATGKDCPQDGRINLPCGNCGPNVSVALTRTIFCTRSFLFSIPTHLLRLSLAVGRP